MTSETIFGSGNMGNAIAGVLASRGSRRRAHLFCTGRSKQPSPPPLAPRRLVLRSHFLIAGDDVDAKATRAAAISAGGVDAIDTGSLSRARELEAVGFLQLTPAVGEKVGWTDGSGVVR